MPRARRAGSISWRSAAAELALIVVGVLIALAASDWESGRAQRRTEQATLREIAATLSADVELLEAALSRSRGIDDRGSLLSEYLRASGPYADSLDLSFGAVFQAGPALELNAAAYESLKSQGLGIISNESLRLEIARVYEQTYPRVQRVSEDARAAVLEVFRPFLLRLFEDVRFGQSATPIDYDSLIDNVEFLNTLDYRIQIVRQTHIPVYERSISDLQELRRSILAELG